MSEEGTNFIFFRKSGFFFILAMEEYFSAKLRYLSTGLCGVTCQKSLFFNGLLCLLISDETKISQEIS